LPQYVYIHPEVDVKIFQWYTEYDSQPRTRYLCKRIHRRFDEEYNLLLSCYDLNYNPKRRCCDLHITQVLVEYNNKTFIECIKKEWNPEKCKYDVEIKNVKIRDFVSDEINENIENWNY